jgi:hypothetical protein
MVVTVAQLDDNFAKARYRKQLPMVLVILGFENLHCGDLI